MTKEQALLQVAPIPSKNYDEIIKAKDDEIRRLNNLYADTIKDLGDALIEIERLKEQLKIDLNEPLKSITINQMSGGKDEY